MTARLGIDIGGSGSRVALVTAASGARRELAGPRVEVRSGGDGVERLALELLDLAAAAWPEEVAVLGAVGLGATGLATLVADPDALADTLAGRLRAYRVSNAHSGVRPAPRVAVAIDAVTAHLGALGGADGAVVALGTGAIALGRSGADWRRVDGWGHLLGDRGGGAWIGMRGLQLALRAADGVDPSGAALLGAARERFGDPLAWPAQLYTRDDRAGIMAAFATDVVALAEHDRRGGPDPVAVELVLEAGREAARSALAALRADQAAVVTATGGLIRGSRLLAAAFSEELTRLRPAAREVPAVGDPLDGALALAGLAVRGEAAAAEPFLWLGAGKAARP